jgi:adrenergic receptor alpha-1D
MLEVLQGQWLFGRTFCHIWLAIDVLYCTASIYGLMFISIERYIGVTRPLRYPILITHRRTIYAIVTAWLVAALISMAPFLGWKNKINSIDNTCEVNDDVSYVFFSCSFSFYMPLIIILCLYGRIYGEANRQYRFLTGGEKQVRLNDTVGQECVTLRIHLPKNLLTTSTLTNGHSIESSHGRQLAATIPTTGSSKISRLKRERKAGKFD